MDVRPCRRLWRCFCRRVSYAPLARPVKPFSMLTKLTKALTPFLARRGLALYVVLFAGLACAAAAFALLQRSSSLYLLILARVLQGLAAAAITAASSTMLATAAGAMGRPRRFSLFTPAVLQNVAMTAAPTVAGLLYDYLDPNSVFYCANALISLNVLLTMVAAATTRLGRITGRPEGVSAAGSQSPGYGTISGSSQPRRSSQTSSRSVSPTALLPTGSIRRNASTAVFGAVAWSPRLLVALFGYLAVGVLASALHSVLPLFVERHFNWSVAASGLVFIPLSAPAALIGPLFGALAARVPKSSRFSTGIGFLATVPAFLYLGRLQEGDTQLAHYAFVATLGVVSLALGLCADPLVQEITSVVGSSAGISSASAAAQITSLPNFANAWGTLVGPLFAGAVRSLWGWATMSKLLAAVGACAGLVSLLFLQGWIGSPHPTVRSRHSGPSSDEEAAPLLRNDRSDPDPYGPSEGHGGKKGGFYSHNDDSDGVSPHTRQDQGRKHRAHRRHFSVDNFSLATTAAPGSLDSSTSSIRFQAALETPVHGPASGARRRSQASDTGSRTHADRRYVLREASHAPATDPLLAAGSLYVIDEERDAGRGAESERQKRRVVVFAEGTAPPELLQRHRHHVVAINALDGTARMVSDRADSHSVHVTEETGDEEPAFPEATSRRYVVVLVEEDDDSSSG